MPIGPTLPPMAGKRKRDNADHENDSDSSDDTGPQLPDKKPEVDVEAKKARVMGPSMPPPMNETSKTGPKTAPDDTDSSDDDDYGPSLPSATDTSVAKSLNGVETAPRRPVEAARTQSTRDEWMTLAPSSGDWSQRVDPTKLKNRKFNTGVSATTSRSGGDSWHETPEQKQARLQREVLGIKDEKGPKTVNSVSSNPELDSDTARRMKEYNKQRGPSLYDAHQKSQTAEADDDPSARAFDREKDIGGGLNINASKRRDMLKKSANFDSRFSSAKYL